MINLNNIIILHKILQVNIMLTPSQISKLLLITFLVLPIHYLSASSSPKNVCQPINEKDILTIENYNALTSYQDESWGIRISLKNDFNGKMWLNDSYINNHNLKVIATINDTEFELLPILEKDQRSCLLVSEMPKKVEETININIPAGYFELSPDYVEVDTIDIDKELLSHFSVAGAWHKQGSPWTGQGMFSIIDDDSMDGQISSSFCTSETYGYYSLLYPLLESIGLKGNLAVEGRRVGLYATTPKANDNLKTIIRLQNEKGWDILAHSLICIGEYLNNWMVDSLNTPLADKILAEGPNKGEKSATVSVYDRQTQVQYWPNPDNTVWVETPSKFIKPYIGDYETKKAVLYNSDFDIDWHWGEWKRRAMDFGVNPKGFVTHNSTSSHAMVPGIVSYFPNGFSDLYEMQINTPPILTSAVRCSLDAYSPTEYAGISTDNTYNIEDFKRLCAKIDKAVNCGGWIMFNLHAYRDCWKNELPGMLVSEGGTYPDEWVIPMKGLDSANAPLSPPEHLGISNWNEWYPCPGTRLYMLWETLKYAKEKGLINVTSSQGFDIMGNKEAYGYFSNGYKFGMDKTPSIGTRDMYPHYVVSVTDEVYYYNPVISDEISYSSSVGSVTRLDQSSQRLIISGKKVIWTSEENSKITLIVTDLTGKQLILTHDTYVDLTSLNKGVYIISAINGDTVDTIKLII